MPRRRSKKNHKGGVLYGEETAAPLAETTANQGGVLHKLRTGISDIGVAGQGVVQGATRMATEAKDAVEEIERARTNAHQKDQSPESGFPMPVRGGRRKKRKSRKRKRKSRKKKRRTKRRRKSRRKRRR